MKKKILMTAGLCIMMAVSMLTQPANATVSLIAAGTSAKGVAVEFEAQLTLSGDILTIELFNNSPVDSLNPDDLLGSFYFDIVNGSGIRPTLTYDSATGDTYIGVKNGPDTLLQTGADLQAFAAEDDTWQFKDFDSALQPPTLSDVVGGFGLGTVGNSNLSLNGFDGSVVNGVDFAIYKGEITTQPLTNPDHLVKDKATFTFTGATGYTEADIVDLYAFGLGTAPDSLLIPEPATLVLLGLGSLLLRPRKIRQQQYGLSEEA